jgi:hypothetical protein
MNKNLQIYFLPWVGVRKNIKLGPITFWPYYIEANQKVSDLKVKAYLDNYFKSFVNHQGKPVDTITMCSHGNVDFRSLNDSECRDLRNTVDILIFAAIAPQIKSAVCTNNWSWGPPSADVFELVTQNFLPGSDNIAVKTGSLLNGGWKIGEITFPKPWAIGGALWGFEEELIEGFDKCFSAEFPESVRERLFRSLEWFRIAHVEGGQVSVLSKVVMTATAFEILLQVPNVPNKKQWIVNELEKWISNSNFLKETRKVRKGNDHTYSKVGWWGWDFYKIRNSIVHGDIIKLEILRYYAPNREWLTHLIVADLIFWECIKRELFNHKCIGDNIYSLAKECNKILDRALPEEPKSTFIKQLSRWFLGFNEIHKALGWILEKRTPNSTIQ